jgi:hypothetical protein
MAVRLGLSLGDATLTSSVVGITAFGCTFGAAILAMLIRSRLPAHHLEGDSKEVVKLVMGLVATLTALVLGLLISSSYSAYNAQENELQQLGVHVYQLDRILARFGADAIQERELLRRIVAADIARIWPTEGVAGATYAPLAAQEEAEGLFDSIAGLSPKTDLQRLGQSRAVQLLMSIGETQRLLVEQAQEPLSWPFLLVLVSWLMVLFFGFGLCARPNATVAMALFAGSASVAAAILLILQMNQPYGGWMRLSSAPLRDALIQMGR